MVPQEKRIFLNRNEVIQGPSPSCLKVLKNFKSSELSRYFDGYYGSSLRPKLSQNFKLPEGQIIIGYGLEDIFKTIFDSLDPKTDTVLTHKLHYSYYNKYTKLKGIRLREFKLTEGKESFAFDISDCLAKIKANKPSVIIITSPNNPTGNSISAKDLLAIFRESSRETLVVLDESYFGFDLGYNQRSFLALLDKYPNLMILRSFSKFYALAGVRIGFALCGKAVKKMLHYQGAYLGGSRILEGIAVTALTSEPYYKKISREIMSDRDSFIKQTNSLSHFKAYNSKANFVLVRVDARAKRIIERELRKTKVLISKFVSNDLMRVSTGAKRYTRPFLNLLKKIDAKI
jgi:histidinol-phosphate aminotransferase